MAIPGYRRVRAYLKRLGPLQPVFGLTRNLLLAGPLRPSLISYYRSSVHSSPMQTNTAAWVTPFAADEVVELLNQSGFASGLSVTAACVDRLLTCYDANPIQSYINPHRDHAFILELAKNHSLVDVARRYLGVEPVLLETRLHWYQPGKSENPTYFHYDVGDVLSLTFFVFLSDVENADSVTHQVVAGTHRRKTFGELLTRRLDVGVAQRRYPGRVHTIMGKRGTAWFEDTCAFHKHGYVGRMRKAFSIQYAMHRES